MKIYLWTVTIYITPICIIYFFWVIINDMNYPLPFIGLVDLVVGMIFQVLGTFFLYPSDLLEDMNFRKQLKTNVKIYYWWMSLALNVHYAFFITIRLADAQVFTVVSIMVIDFLFHLTYAYKIIQIHSRRATNDRDVEIRKKDQHKAILKLVMAEIVEGIVPLAYAIGFMIAYFGPNAMLIGNVRSGIWAYKAVEDIEWLLIVDMTTNFSWLSNEGRMNFINSSTELKNEEKEPFIASLNSI